MNRSTIAIGGHTFPLTSGQDLAQLIRDATDAVTHGGGVFTFVGVGDRTISVVLSPGVPVVFETVDVEEYDHEVGDVVAQPFEVDFFGYET